ncbi:MAG: hypothetical protein ACLP7W_10635 [Solirubrobacteraceae bacterium]
MAAFDDGHRYRACARTRARGRLEVDGCKALGSKRPACVERILKVQPGSGVVRSRRCGSIDGVGLEYAPALIEELDSRLEVKLGFAIGDALRQIRRGFDFGGCEIPIVPVDLVVEIQVFVLAPAVSCVDASLL